MCLCFDIKLIIDNLNILDDMEHFWQKLFLKIKFFTSF